mmetsp:Transcript_65353/g.188276  ORF Transcript_65353/g.188276 Transcript_65353/m.188276 type:complete len:246 (+) Transcript_65353:1-738(+)
MKGKLPATSARDSAMSTEHPKSKSLISRPEASKPMFSGFKSRCAMPLEWQHTIASDSCLWYRFASSSCKGPRWAFSFLNKLTSEAASMRMKTCIGPCSTPMNLIMWGCFSRLCMCISRYSALACLHRFIDFFDTTFTASLAEDPPAAAQTLPKVPWPKGVCNVHGPTLVPGANSFGKRRSMEGKSLNKRSTDCQKRPVACNSSISFARSARSRFAWLSNRWRKVFAASTLLWSLWMAKSIDKRNS